MENSKNYKIFVINLDRSPDRLNAISEQFAKIEMSFEKFSAIDGKQVSDEFLNQFYSKTLNRKKYFTSLSRGEIACYISHLKVCEKIIADNLDYGIILEDDLILNQNLKLIPSVLEKIDDWKYIKLSAPFKKKKVLTSTTISLESPYSKFELVRWKKNPTGTQAYAISKEGAEDFLKKRSIFFRPIDVDLQFSWETNLDVMGLIPFVCDVADVASDIAHRRAKVHYPLARLIYKLKFAIAKFSHEKLFSSSKK